MQIVKGDLIEMADRGMFDVVIHGCNCRCTMGAGIARRLANWYSGIRYADDSTSSWGHLKLGKFSVCNVAGPEGRHPLLVFNAYTQLDPGRRLDLTALKSSLTSIACIIRPGLKIGIPKIGCGIAGGDWNEVGPVIDDIFLEHDLTLVIYAD